MSINTTADHAERCAYVHGTTGRRLSGPSFRTTTEPHYRTLWLRTVKSRLPPGKMLCVLVATQLGEILGKKIASHWPESKLLALDKL